MKISQAKRFGTDFLKAKRPSEAADLLAHCLNISHSGLFFSDETVSKEAFERYCSLLKRRQEGEPLQQIIGSVEFLHCLIHINKDVLIPRQETELLTDFVIGTIKTKPYIGKTLVDVCTGSGCIAIAIKKALPELHVIAIDISEKALDVAMDNALKNAVSIEFLQGDLLSPLDGRGVDFLVSNPPYVTEEEYGELDDSVRLYEPIEALVSGPTGLEFYQKIASLLPTYLNRPGALFLEIGSTQGNAVKLLFDKDGVVHKDFAAHDRYFSLEIE